MIRGMRLDLGGDGQWMGWDEVVYFWGHWFRGDMCTIVYCISVLRKGTVSEQKGLRCIFMAILLLLIYTI